MGENSKIEWTTHSFNPWTGCTEIGPGCSGCYAHAWARRTGQPELWQGKRRRTSAANWKKPLKWNRDARASGARPRVFCASLADVFDNEVPTAWRADLFALIRKTPQLDWMLLTKRIGNARFMMMQSGLLKPLDNVWLGATIVTQEEADRDIPKLLATPAHIRFLSCEPLLERLDLSPWLDDQQDRSARALALHLIIVGGESGPKARPMAPEWALALRHQCAAAGVPYFFKQGSAANWPDYKNFESFPEALQIREFPSSSEEPEPEPRRTRTEIVGYSPFEPPITREVPITDPDEEGDRDWQDIADRGDET